MNKRKFEKISIKEWEKRCPKDVFVSQWVELWYDIKKPERKTISSSGYDFHIPYGITLEPQEDVTIPTGIKACMNEENELLLFPRSGLGFKFYARLANVIGKVDSDYFDNPDNEGHIFVKIRNEGTVSMTLYKGDAFCQGSFYNYLVTCDDEASGIRVSGLGSTDEK